MLQKIFIGLIVFFNITVLGFVDWFYTSKKVIECLFIDFIKKNIFKE